MTAFPDINHTFLFHDPGSDCDVVYCAWTGEWRPLLGRPWQIGYDERGVAILRPDGPSWASALLRERLELTDDGTILVHSFGSTRLLKEHFGDHQRKTVVLEPCGAEGIFVDVAAFATRILGAFVWWSLPSLYKCLGISGSAASWYHRFWLAWVTWLDSLGLPPPHARRAAMTRGEVSPGREETNWSSQFRCLPFYSLSSYALLALLVRWSTGKSARSGKSDRANAFKACLSAVVKRLFVAAQSMRLFLFPAVCMPGIPLDGSAPINLPVAVGRVNLQPLLDSDEPVAEKWCRMLRVHSHGPLMALEDLLIATFDSGVAFLSFFRQLVMLCGGAIDRVAHSGQQDTHVDRCVVVVPDSQSQRMKSRLKNKLIEHVRRDTLEKMTHRRCQYSFAIRRAFHEQKVVHLAIDASRMGQKQVFSSCIALPSGKCAICPPQVSRDYLTSARLALDAEDTTAIEEERSSWVESAKRFWDQAQGTGDNPHSKPKPKRVKSYNFLCVVEHLLRICMGVGSVMRFQIREDASAPLPPAPSSWPGLTLVLDQGSDGWAAQSFLAYGRFCNVLTLKDPAHRCWNDVCAALKQCNAWFIVLAFNVVCSCDHGPWSDARWYSQAVEAAKTYQELVDPVSCQIFQRLLPRLARDKGLPPDPPSEDMLAEWFNEVHEAYATKLPKVAASRWFAVFDALESLDKVWHSRLIVLLYICINEGWMKGGFEAQMRVAASVAGQGSGEERHPTRQDIKEVRDLKGMCRNNLHFCCSLLMDGDHQGLLRGLRLVAELVRCKHGLDLQANRSTSACLAYYVQESAGAGFLPLLKTASLLQDAGFWDDVGVWVGGALPHAILSIESVAAADDELASKVADFAASLIIVRMKEARPGSFPRLLDPLLAESTLRRLRSDYDLYRTEVQTRRGAFWNGIRKRSSFNLMCVMQVVERACLDNWILTEELRSIVRNRFLSIAGTKIVEDCFQRGRQEECRGGNQNKEMQPSRMYDSLIRSRMVGDIHHYDEVEWASQDIPRGSASQIPASLFCTPVRKATPDLKNIISTSASVPWYSPAPSHAPQVDVDIALVEHLRHAGAWDSVSKLWLCTLLRCGRLMIRRRKTKGPLGRWMLALGDMHGAVGLGWPLVEAPVGEVCAYILDTTISWEHVQMLFVYDLADWEAMLFDWKSALGLKVVGKVSGASTPATISCAMLPRSKALPLLSACATDAFGSMPLHMLKSVAGVIGAPWTASDDLFSALRSLVRFIFPKISEGDLLSILAKRIPATSALETYMMSGGADGVLEEDDEKELGRMREAAQSQEKVIVPFATSYKQAAEAYRSSKLTAAAKKKPRPTVRHVSLPTDVTAEILTSFCPPDFRIWLDSYNSRWQVFEGKRRMRNFSFTAYGMVGAGKLAVESAWSRHTALGGEPSAVILDVATDP